ncbi:MAG: PEP-CTERM sorting domain-containing protein [Syntrophotaleaceae bacterium]
MKKFAFVVLALLFIAGSAWATPIYQGNPYAPLGTGNSAFPDFNDPNFKGAGYYIWANNAARTSWSVRWTGREIDGSYGRYDWRGYVAYSVDGIDSLDMVLWEGNDGSASIMFSDMITFGQAKAGPHWDGFDFTVSGQGGDYLTFMLGSTLFDLSNLDRGIYLGADYEFVLDNVDSVADFAGSNGRQRQFEAAAPVPEPGTLLLLGAGLTGLGYIRCRKKA